MRFPNQFRLRSVLVLILVAAVMLAIWRTRPADHLVVEVLPTGSFKVNGSEYSKPMLSDALRREHAWRRIWRMNDETIRLTPDPQTAHSDVVELVELGRDAGFEKIVLSITALEGTSPK